MLQQTVEIVSGDMQEMNYELAINVRLGFTKRT